MVDDLPNLANLDLVTRVNRAIDHIVQNLERPLKLEDVARVACFSPFHFHRVFQSLLGETLHAFVKRVRLERAVFLLAFREGVSLTEIALACGFSSSSDFSRSFRKRYGVSPRGFDVASFRRSRRKMFDRRHLLQHLPPGENPDGFTVRITELAPRRFAYLRVQRPYEPGRVTDAAAKLVGWARSRGLDGGQWVGYMWDVPEIVAPDKCRYDVGVEVSAAQQADGDVGMIDFPAMTMAEIEIAGGIDLEQRAMDWMYGTWLPSSGLVPGDQPCFEAWNGEPFAHGEGHFELRVQLPVVGATLPL